MEEMSLLHQELLGGEKTQPFGCRFTPIFTKLAKITPWKFRPDRPKNLGKDGEHIYTHAHRWKRGMGGGGGGGGVWEALPHFSGKNDDVFLVMCPLELPVICKHMSFKWDQLTHLLWYHYYMYHTGLRTLEMVGGGTSKYFVKNIFLANCLLYGNTNILTLQVGCYSWIRKFI